jgi:ATP-dependent DNA helicase RecG
MVAEKTIRDISQAISNHIEPKIFPKIKEVVLEEKNCVCVEFSGNNVPYYAYGGAYIRVGDEDRKMSAKELEKFILEKNKDKLRWDKEICSDAKLSDISKEKVRWFLRKAKAERNFNVDPETTLKESLERLKLMKNNHLTNAAVLLFGKEPQKFFLQARIRCARFKGVKGLDYIDMKVLDGTIPELREKAMKFIMQHTKHGVFFDANRRYDKWEYPLRALEEVLTNALAHRVYSSPSEIHVSVHDDRIEVWNPGELPKPLIPSDLKKKHKSIPRNPLIAEMLFLIRYIEKWGRGTNRVIEELLENKLSEPKFQNLSGGFEAAITGPGKEFEEEIEKEKLHVLEINERQKKAIKYIKEKGRITKETYQSLNNISSATAKRDIKDLINKKVFKQIGRGPSVYYMLKL